MHATGTFDVKVTPQPLADPAGETGLSRMLIDKQFHGDLDASSKGEMLGAGDPQKGAAGYVAIERVTGKLNGRSGSFALQHRGTMDKSGMHLEVSVVPGSSTGDLEGISGTMQIIIEAGKHSYTFDYTLPEKH